MLVEKQELEGVQNFEDRRSEELNNNVRKLVAIANVILVKTQLKEEIKEDIVEAFYSSINLIYLTERNFRNSEEHNSEKNVKGRINHIIFHTVLGLAQAGSGSGLDSKFWDLEYALKLCKNNQEKQNLLLDIKKFY